MNKHYLRARQTNSLIPKLDLNGSIFGGGGSICFMLIDKPTIKIK